MHIQFDGPAGLLFSLVWGGLIAWLASSKGRNPVGWFFIGFFLSCIGLIILLVLPDLELEQRKKQRLATENRRLKEQLHKDRQVQDRRYVDTQRRLDVHDQSLGVDTQPRLRNREDDEALLVAGSPQAEATGSIDESTGEIHRPGEPLGTTDDKRWYYLVGDKQVGPVRVASLRTLWDDGAINEQTYAWSPDLTDWAPIREIPSLRDTFRA